MDGPIRHINQCVNVAGEAGPWMVLSDFGWQLDKTVFVTCESGVSKSNVQTLSWDPQGHENRFT